MIFLRWLNVLRNGDKIKNYLEKCKFSKKLYEPNGNGIDITEMVWT